MPALPLAAPRGLRDLLPEATASIAAMQRRLSAGFELAGYQRVTTPAFEYADVLERGLEVDRNQVVRFVEPDTGEVALLRPDITPQIARIVATRLSSRPAPYRLSYQGTVIRRKEGRARRSRMAAQAGIELIGVDGIDGDLEVMRLACQALHRLGLPTWNLELGEVAIARHALASVPKEERQGATEALAQKDRHLLSEFAERGKLSAEETDRLLSLVDLYGGREVIDSARQRFPTFKTELDALDEAFAAIEKELDGSGATVSIDLGELRGHGYYTGLSFSLLAPGPGARLGGGGRYDGLLASFGADLPATGFGIDLHHLEWALSKAGNPPATSARLRAIVIGETPELQNLRDTGICAAHVSGDADFALAYARAWGYDVVIEGEEICRVLDGARRSAAAMDSDETRAWARGE
ncbi:MAG: ATP phosphoribosyltransferase regulatory subunit [Polyangiales bacterium]